MAAYKAAQEQSGISLSQEKLAELYTAKVRASAGESVNRDYIGMALRVFQHILSDNTCRALVLKAPSTQCNVTCDVRLRAVSGTQALRGINQTIIVILIGQSVRGLLLNVPSYIKGHSGQLMT